MGEKVEALKEVEVAAETEALTFVEVADKILRVT